MRMVFEIVRTVLQKGMEKTEGLDGQETTSVGSGWKPEAPHSASQLQEVDLRRGGWTCTVPESVAIIPAECLCMVVWLYGNSEDDIHFAGGPGEPVPARSPE